jgi:hypothetical protein
MRRAGHVRGELLREADGEAVSAVTYHGELNADLDAACGEWTRALNDAGHFMTWEAAGDSVLPERLGTCQKCGGQALISAADVNGTSGRTPLGGSGDPGLRCRGKG